MPVFPVQVTQTPIPVLANVFKVEAWVDHPTPGEDQRVIVYGSLLKYHTRLGGIMMRATWPDKDHPLGTPNCFVLVTYGRGVCTIDTSRLPSGVYVPVTVSFDYGNQRYSGQTGFTP